MGCWHGASSRSFFVKFGKGPPPRRPQEKSFADSSEKSPSRHAVTCRRPPLNINLGRHRIPHAQPGRRLWTARLRESRNRSCLGRAPRVQVFHNRLTANPVAALFGWATPKFGEILDEVQDLLFQRSTTDSTITGVVFTFAWGIDLPDDTTMMEKGPHHASPRHRSFSERTPLGELNCPQP